MTRIVGTLAVLVCFAVAANAQEKVAVPGCGVRFDATISESIDNKPMTMRLTGVALRTKLLFNVYALGSYVAQDANPRNAEELAAADVAKRLHLVMERDVASKDMAQAIRQGILANYPESAFPTELKLVEDYLRANPIRKSMNFHLTHVPGVGLLVSAGDKQALEIRNPKFSTAVWQIYLGRKNLGDHIKRGLVSRL